MLSVFVPPNYDGPLLGYFAALLIAAFIVGIAKGGFGGGIGMLSVPVMLLVLPPKTVIPLLVPVLITCDIFTMRSFPNTWDKQGFLLIAPGMVVGLFAGLLLLGRMRPADIKLAIGILTLTFCVITWLGLGNKPLFARASLVKGSVVGLACGIATMLAHSAGAIVNMFLLSRRLDKETFIGTTARFYFVFNVSKVPIFGLNPNPAGPHFDWQTFLWSSWVLPFCPLAVWIGVWMQRRFSQEAFRGIIYVTLVAIAGKLIWDSLGEYAAGPVALQ